MTDRENRRSLHPGGFHLVVIGGSAGGLEALELILARLPENFSFPILLVQHLHKNDQGSFAKCLANMTKLSVIDPCDKTLIEPGCVYVAPANYHMLIEKNGDVALSVDPKVNFSRPAIDLLFESAARNYGQAVIAVLLSGASRDGVAGIQKIKMSGGHTIAQDPKEARVTLMPRSAIEQGMIDEVLTADRIGRRLIEFSNNLIVKG